ncbi:hypothetical protein [Neobacillus cucumis]|uniref:hypothetical protein n=1 Tax=Neobacillus cucumis TaxID=1740721 RepID=UPI001963180C|nr:hypothetical protein [Neobacillus cucumis]MBM7655411.1 hypothetical protein [Neobacillus cucumis]MED4228404.1 hypothetical protein [Neobacillus cucumis]
MIKRIIILVVLSSILLVLVKYQTSTPVNNTSTKSDDSSKYTTIVYTISKIKGDKYYGKRKNGNEIIFSANNITSGEKIQVNDQVICYFDKNDLGEGLVKVEKK